MVKHRALNPDQFANVPVTKEEQALTEPEIIEGPAQEGEGRTGYGIDLNELHRKKIIK